MAGQTVTTTVNYDDASIAGLLDGETLTINGGSVTIDADVRWNQQAAVFGSVSLSSTLGGSFLIDGSKVWEIPFASSSGTVPTQGAIGSNTVTGSTSGATGELTRIWAAGSLTPIAAGQAMPAAGFIKLRSKTGTFQAGETITLPGGATITAASAGKRSWISVAAKEATTLTIPRIGNFQVNGDWYELGTTNGSDNQVFQFPVADECPGVQVETAPGSGVFEWWLNAGMRWHNIVNVSPLGTTTGGNTTLTGDVIAGPNNPSDPMGWFTTGLRIRETAVTGIHIVNIPGVAASGADSGNYKFRTHLKKETRRYGFVQANSGTNYYGAIIDFDASGAVVMEPTSGTPTGTSTTVTPLADGWFLVELTLDHVLANALAMYIGTSNSAAPTLTTGRPTFLGVTTEGMYYSEGQIIAPSTWQFVPDDVRGKYFYSNPTTGALTFATRTPRIAGMKPASGCKVRAPNVVLSTASPIDYPRHSLHQTAATRYDITTTSGGAVTIKNAVCNWYLGATNAFTYTLEDTATWAAATSNIAGLTTIKNCGIGASRDINVLPISLTNSFSGGEITDVRVMRLLSANAYYGIAINTCAGFTLTRVQSDIFQTSGRPLWRGHATAVGPFNIQNCSDTVFYDCTCIGGQLMIVTSSDTRVLNLKYADRILGTTDANNGGYGILVSTSANNTYIDGFTNFAGLADVHPYVAVLAVTTNCDGVEFRNLGTPAAPYNCGSVSANACGSIVTLLATSLNITLRRLYAINTRTNAINTVNTVQNVRAYNVWGDYADAQAIASMSQTSQGCKWSNTSAAQTAVYGTHWEDAFTGPTSGRITIHGNEPLATTADQCTTTLGANAGFTSAGTIAMPNVGDEVVWTMPYYALGHTGISKFSYGANANETWVFTGTAQQNFEFMYQIDKNDKQGFSAWKPLLDTARRAGLGTVGTNQIQVYLAEWQAMTNPPQVGYYLQGASANVPSGTTITDIAIGSSVTLTLSNTITVAWGTNTLVYFWKDIADETISSTSGYKLKVKARVNAAASTNAFSFLRIPFDTTEVAQQIQYPLPTTQNTASVTNIRAGSRLRVYNVTTATEMFNDVVEDTSWSVLYDEGNGYSDGDIINVRLARCLGPTASIGFEGTAVVGPTGWALYAEQSDDLVYNANGIDGTTVTEFVADYPNVQIDINDPDGTTTITRLYAWWAKERTTAEGIRKLIGGLVAEDTANYKIVTSRIDLKLDNSASTGVQFVGDLRLYRDDGAAPVVSSTSGGGSITLYAGKVYTVETGTSGLTPTEAATLAKIDALTENVSGLRFTAKALETAPTGGGTGGGATPAEIWTYATRTLTSDAAPSAATVANAVWTAATRELTVASGLTSSQETKLNEIKAKTDNLPSTPANEATVASRLAASAYVTPPTASANASAVWSATTRELTVASGLTPAQEVKLNDIKAKTDNLPATPANEATVASRLAASVYVAPDNSGVATLTARLTETRAQNLDKLDKRVSDVRFSQATDLVGVVLDNEEMSGVVTGPEAISGSLTTDYEITGTVKEA